MPAVRGHLGLGSGSYVLLINIVLAALVVAGFWFTYLRDRRRVHVLYWIAAAGLVLTTGVIEAVMPYLNNSAPVRVLSFAAFLGGVALLDAGIAHYYRAEFPKGPITVLFVVSLLLNVAILDMERNSTLRVLLFQAPYFVMGMIGVSMIFRASRKAVLDYLFLAVTFLFNLHFILRPFWATMLGGMGETASQYLNTPYAVFDQTVMAILAMALVTVMALLLVRDVVSGLVKVSVTDPLSGLLNRRGFLESAKNYIDAARPGNPQVFMVIADIDHFKTINDRYGHETGDRVIQAFGDLLAMLSSTGTSVARIGGEEFAVLFAAPNESLARLYCEGVRTAAEVGAADKNRDLPRFTVSFGLAAHVPGEKIDALSRRADLALYRAKEEGRNRTSVADQLQNAAAAASMAA